MDYLVKIIVNYNEHFLAVNGPRVCQSCLENNADTCTLNQNDEFCGRYSNFGKTHCGAAKVKAKDDLNGNVTVRFIRGCIDCSGELIILVT